MCLWGRRPAPRSRPVTSCAQCHLQTDPPRLHRLPVGRWGGRGENRGRPEPQETGRPAPGTAPLEPLDSPVPGTGRSPRLPLCVPWPQLPLRAHHPVTASSLPPLAERGLCTPGARGWHCWFRGPLVSTLRKTEVTQSCTHWTACRFLSNDISLVRASRSYVACSQESFSPGQRLEHTLAPERLLTPLPVATRHAAGAFHLG